MTYRARNIVVAVALAVVAALLTGFYVINYKRSVQHGQHSVAVLVAKKDIPVGTPGSELSSRGFLRTEYVPRRALVPGAATTSKDVEKLVATQQTYAGEQVSTLRFSTPQNQGVRAQLKGSLRAVQVSGDANQLLAGTLKTGDHVDVLANLKVGDNDVHFDRVVLRDLLVLRAPGPPSSTAKLGGVQNDLSVMLAVTDTQAPKLWYTVKNADPNGSTGGGWSLQLRPVVDPTDSPEAVEWIKTMLLDGLNRYQYNRVKNGGLR